MGRLIKHELQTYEVFMIQSRKELKEYIAQDRRMNKIPSSFIKRWLHNIVFPNSIWRFLEILRYAEFYNNVDSILGFFLKNYYKIKLKRISANLGFDIPVNTCGPGLSIPHIGPIIINSQAEIGKNCRIHACVNIGASGGSIKAPKIGDNVYIGPSAVIFGDIKIADNCTIGANSTVNKSVEISNSVIVGTPAHIIKNEVPSWVITTNKR